MIIFWFVFVRSKYLDGRKSLDTVLTAQGLMLICVHCTNFDNILRKYRQVTLSLPYSPVRLKYTR